MSDLTAYPAEIQAHLAESGITPEAAADCGIVWDASRGLVFPYHDPLTGAPLPDANGAPFERWRLFGFGGQPMTRGNGQKYKQAPGSGIRLYFPPCYGWTELEDSDPLLVTEGEKKAIAACLAGWPCVGLPGTSSFALPGFGQQILHPDWDLLGPLTGRKLIVIFDADAQHNTNVMRDRARLDAALTRAGARVLHADLSVLDEHTKLDDALKKYGRDAIAEVIANAERLLDPRVVEFDKRHIYLTSTGKVFDLVDEIEMTTKHAQESYGHLGLLTKPMPAKGLVPNVWLKWPGHRRVFGRAMRPGQPRFYTDEGKDFINNWRGWKYKPVQGDTALFEALLEHLVPDPAARKHLRQWMAYMLQTGRRPNTAVALIGKPGSGKSLLCAVLRRLHDPYSLPASGGLLNHSNTTDRQDFFGQYTFLYQDDAESTPAQEQRLINFFKSLITLELAASRAMRDQIRRVRNFTQVMLCTNHVTTLKLERDDRRWSVIPTSTSPLPKWIAKALGDREGDRFEDHAEAIMYALVHDTDLSDFDPDQTFHTELREDVVEATQEPEREWLQQIARAYELGPEAWDEGLRPYMIGSVQTPTSLFREMQRAKTGELGKPAWLTRGPVNQSGKLWQWAKEVWAPETTPLAWRAFSSQKQNTRRKLEYLVLDPALRHQGEVSNKALVEVFLKEERRRNNPETAGDTLDVGDGPQENGGAGDSPKPPRH